MNKKVIISFAAVFLVAVLGFGIYQSDAANSNPELTLEDARQLVEIQYPGTITEIELDKEQGETVYEVEVVTDDKEYEVKLDANTGEIIKLEEKHKKQSVTNDQQHQTEYDVKKEHNKNVPEQNKKSNMIEMTTAIEIAIQEFPGTVTEAELDREDGRLIYEIGIKSKGEEAEIEIDAYTGEVIVIEIDD